MKAPIWYDTMMTAYSGLVNAAGKSGLHKKAGLLAEGRSGWRAKLKAAASDLVDPIWMHCASLGEFEQGRPLLEALAEKYPSRSLVLSFYSPSGYELRKNYSGADYVCYLPADTAENARDFVSLLKPSAAFFVKYEFWLNHLHALKAAEVPTYLVAGLFFEEQVFFKSYGGAFRNALPCFDHLFCQDEASLALLRGIGIENASYAPDTRYDRVAQIAAQASVPDSLGSLYELGGKVLVAGSTWSDDEKLLARLHEEVLKPAGWKLIIAPHEIHEAHLRSVQKLFPHALRYSQLETANEAPDCLLIDNIGMLSALYRLGSFAYVGGGFGAGIHNTLEAAVYGMPVIFGPKYKQFSEAVGLIDAGAANSITVYEGLKDLITELISNESARMKKGECANRFVKSRIGGTLQILDQLKV